MRYLSPIISAASASVGGSTFMEGRGSSLLRARVAPVARRTKTQSLSRAVFAAITQSWKTLTQKQIAAWNAFAQTVTLHDALGHPFTPSGFQAYVSCNRNLHAVAQPYITNAPTGTPQFSSQPKVGLSAQIRAGVAYFYMVTSPVAWANQPPGLLLRSTYGYSPGQTRLTHRAFRIVPRPFPIGGGNLVISNSGNPNWPMPQVGQRTSVELTWVDIHRGIAQPPVRYDTVVTAA